MITSYCDLLAHVESLDHARSGGELPSVFPATFILARALVTRTASPAETACWISCIFSWELLARAYFVTIVGESAKNTPLATAMTAHPRGTAVDEPRVEPSAIAISYLTQLLMIVSRWRICQPCYGGLREEWVQLTVFASEPPRPAGILGKAYPPASGDPICSGAAAARVIEHTANTRFGSRGAYARFSPLAGRVSEPLRG